MQISSHICEIEEMSVDWVPGGDGAGTAQDIEDNSGGGGSTQLQHCPGIVDNGKETNVFSC